MKNLIGFKYGLLVVMMFALLGCKDKASYSYLTQHPLYLKDQIMHCRTLDQSSAAQTAECETVMAAATYVGRLVDEQAANPEQYGQHILDKEAAYANAGVAWKQAQQTLTDLQARHANAAEIAKAEKALSAVASKHHALHEEVKALLAVSGLNSPE